MDTSAPLDAITPRFRVLWWHWTVWIWNYGLGLNLLGMALVHESSFAEFFGKFAYNVLGYAMFSPVCAAVCTGFAYGIVRFRAIRIWGSTVPIWTGVKRAFVAGVIMAIPTAMALKLLPPH